MKEQEVTEKLAADFEGLLESFQVSLIYQDVAAEIPAETVTFELEKTIENAETGTENAVKSTVSEDSLRTFLHQQFSPKSFSDEEVTTIAEGIEQELEAGIMPTQVYITDLIIGTEFEKNEVAKSSLTVSSVSTSMTKAIQALNGTEIDAFATFSLLDFIENHQIGNVADDELTKIASVLYSTILKTNFTVDERYIGETLHEDVPIGYEAVMNQNLGIDFIFTNRNKTPFTLNIAVAGQQLSASLTGLPLLYTYEIDISPVTEFKPRTIEEFSAFISQGKMQVKQEGVTGKEVTVTRTVFHGGEEVEHSTVATDFYAPIHRIELHPLIDKSQIDTIPGNTGNGTENQSDGSTNSGTNENKEKDKNLPDDKKTQESPSATDKDKDEIQYDKGGNVIN